MADIKLILVFSKDYLRVGIVVWQSVYVKRSVERRREWGAVFRRVFEMGCVG